MKKIIVFVVIFVLLFGGLSVAIDNNSIKVDKAEKYFSQAEKRTIVHRVNMDYNRGQSIYLRLIYEEEKKQTEMLQKIMSKLNIK
jgi:hypothetical protein